MGTFMTNADKMLKAIDAHITKTIHQYKEGIIFYGSFIEAQWGLGTPVRDIDVTVIINTPNDLGIKNLDTTTIRLPECGNLDINIEFVDHGQYVSDIMDIEPKFLMFYTPDQFLNRSIGTRFGMLNRGHIRKRISRAADKAFDKGRKKLVKVDDYDPVLGLKNIYHAFKFPVFMMWHYYDINDGLNMDHAKELQIIYLQEIRMKIEKIYYSTEGTLDERCRAVLDFAKPEWNKLMTSFRKFFPKE